MTEDKKDPNNDEPPANLPVDSDAAEAESTQSRANSDTQAEATDAIEPEKAESADAGFLPEPVTAEEPATEPENATVEDVKKASDVPPKKKRRIPWAGMIITLVLLLLIGAVSGMGWYGYQYLQTEQQGTSLVEQQQQQLQAQLAQQAQQLQQLTTQQRGRAEAAAQSQQQSSQQTRDLQERIQALEQRIIAQNKRLLAMSTVTREDWLLAEAEYLLKLANQRILIEHSADGAESLLTEADNILRDLDDPDLFPLRRAVKNDLAALRLVSKIDIEGIYLEIDGLINQLPSLPLKPTRQQLMGKDALVEDESEPQDWKSKLGRSFDRFTHALGQYIRVRDHSVEAKALLSPDTAQYLMQNVRLILERAQLALLREQTTIYQQSLAQAQSYITRFYPESNAASLYQDQLNSLSEREIVTELPDISPSLELLHAYIEDLHQLNGAKPATQGAQ